MRQETPVYIYLTLHFSQVIYIVISLKDSQEDKTFILVPTPLSMMMLLILQEARYETCLLLVDGRRLLDSILEVIS